MITKFVGMKEFRQNMAKISGNAHRNKHRLVILRKNKAMFAVTPLSKKEQFEEELLLDAQNAMADYKAGRTHSTNEVRKRLGLAPL